MGREAKRNREFAMKPRRAGRSEKAGLPPGTIVYVGPRRPESVRITLLEYDASDFHEREVSGVEDCLGVCPRIRSLDEG